MKKIALLAFVLCTGNILQAQRLTNNTSLQCQAWYDAYYGAAYIEIKPRETVDLSRAEGAFPYKTVICIRPNGSTVNLNRYIPKDGRDRAINCHVSRMYPHENFCEHGSLELNFDFIEDIKEERSKAKGSILEPLNFFSHLKA